MQIRGYPWEASGSSQGHELHQTLTLARCSPNPLLGPPMRRPSRLSRTLLANSMARRQPAFLNVASESRLRSSSAPPSPLRNVSLNPPASTGHTPLSESHRYQRDPHPSPNANGFNTTSLDSMNSLQRAEGAVVKTRSGSVLSRGFILKTDHYPSGAPIYLGVSIYLLLTVLPGRALDLDLNVHGAPNFRAPRVGDLNVFGVAQPRTQGLRAILSILRCRPNTPNPSHVVWFSTREEPIGEPL